MTAIRPDQIDQARKDYIPEEVIAVFNELIIENFNGNQAVVYQDDAEAKIAEVLGIQRQVVYDRRYMDIEQIFREAGWKVEYDSPAYCESFRAHWTFIKPRK